MNSNIQEKVAEIFTEYLKKNNFRRTPERYKILEEIYHFEGHFTVEELFILINQKNYMISRATLYNTIDLLDKCNLVKKHQFRDKTSLYEKAYLSTNHDHLICEKCGKIFEFCDPRLYEIINDIASQNNFKVKSHELYIKGLCHKCKKK